MQSDTEVQNFEGELDQTHYQRLKLIFKEIGKRRPDMNEAERTALIEEQRANLKNVTNASRKNIIPIEKVYKKISESLEVFYLVMSRMILEKSNDRSDSDIIVLTNYILDLKEHKVINQENELVSLASNIYQKVDRRLKRDERYKKTDTTYGLEAELDNLGDLNEESSWISAIDNLQNLGMRVVFDSARELPMSKSESPIDQLRALIELKKMNIILPSDHFSLHVNIGGIEQPREILEDVFVLNSIVKLLSKNLITRPPELNEDSTFQMDTSGSKSLFENLGRPIGFNIVLRESDVIEYRDLVTDPDFTFKDVAKILLIFSTLVDLVKSYSKVKSGNASEQDILDAKRWVSIKESFYTKVGVMNIEGQDYNLPAHIKALTSYVKYFGKEIENFKEFNLTDEEIRINNAEDIVKERKMYIDRRRSTDLLGLMNTIRSEAGLDQKDNMRFGDYYTSVFSGRNDFILKESDSEKLRKLIKNFEVESEAMSRVSSDIEEKADYYSFSTVKSRLINDRHKEFLERTKDQREEVIRLANLDPSFLRYKKANPQIIKDIDAIAVFYVKSNTLNYLDAQLMRRAFSDLTHASNELYHEVLNKN
ncbi:MAG: hypothetical protein ACMG57_01835 [Candidatus Dojkabacteria bacterium]